MVTFLAVNTSSITLIPTTVIAIRMNYHAASPTDIVGPTLVATFLSAIGAILMIAGFIIEDPESERDERMGIISIDFLMVYSSLNWFYFIVWNL